jgi:hypothetical protein
VIREFLTFFARYSKLPWLLVATLVAMAGIFTGVAFSSKSDIAVKGRGAACNSSACLAIKTASGLIVAQSRVQSAKPSQPTAKPELVIKKISSFQFFKQYDHITDAFFFDQDHKVVVVGVIGDETHFDVFGTAAGDFIKRFYSIPSQYTSAWLGYKDQYLITDDYDALYRGYVAWDLNTLTPVFRQLDFFKCFIICLDFKPPYRRDFFDVGNARTMHKIDSHVQVLKKSPHIYIFYPKKLEIWDYISKLPIKSISYEEMGVKNQSLGVYFTGMSGDENFFALRGDYSALKNNATTISSQVFLVNSKTMKIVEGVPIKGSAQLLSHYLLYSKETSKLDFGFSYLDLWSILSKKSFSIPGKPKLTQESKIFFGIKDKLAIKNADELIFVDLAKALSTVVSRSDDRRFISFGPNEDYLILSDQNKEDWYTIWSALSNKEVLTFSSKPKYGWSSIFFNTGKTQFIRQSPKDGISLWRISAP